MKEIIIRRNRDYINSMMNYKVVIETGQTILIGKGETKIVQLDNIPAKVYAKQGWLRSKDVTIDNSTTELILKNEKIKHWIFTGLGAPLGLSLFYSIWSSSPIKKAVSIVGLSIILIWIIYALIIKRDDWILIDKKTTD